jgi:hypothetical protein
MAEEAPGVLIILIGHQYPDSRGLGTGTIEHILLPDDRQEQGASAVHDGDVGQYPAPIVCLKRFYDSKEEGMLRDCSHCIV